MLWKVRTRAQICARVLILYTRCAPVLILYTRCAPVLIFYLLISHTYFYKSCRVVTNFVILNMHVNEMLAMVILHFLIKLGTRHLAEV